MAVNCSGFDVTTGSYLELQFGRLIDSVDTLIGAPGRGPWLAPGFIDLQVNGFKGVDFCAAGASLDDIGAAIDAILATGTTRFFSDGDHGRARDDAGFAEDARRCAADAAAGPGDGGVSR